MGSSMSRYEKVHWRIIPNYSERSDIMTVLKKSVRSDNPLSGKHIVFLGSSVTYGAASNGVSFVDFLAEKTGCRVTKEAVSGTMLVDDAPDSYICRMRKLNPEMKVDLFVCQLSTNDATQMKELGEACRTYDMDDFDTLTVAGAIEENMELPCSVLYKPQIRQWAVRCHGRAATEYSVQVEHCADRPVE